jgi:mannose-6-phosphate isomerase-like protein (cupin superfamily)
MLSLHEIEEVFFGRFSVLVLPFRRFDFPTDILYKFENTGYIKEIRMRGRIITTFGLLALLTVSIWAQQGGTKAGGAAPMISASEVAALEAKQPKDKNSVGQQMLKLGNYNINMEHRVMGQAAAVHEKEAELFYVIDGSGTIVTGGKLVDEKRTNEANLTGSSIQGGVSKKISKGDWVLVPEGVSHQIPNVDGAITLMSLHLPR